MKLIFNCFAALSLLLVVCTVTRAAPAPLDIVGDWSGTLHVGGADLRLVFHFIQNPDGTLTATFDSVDQGAMGLKFSAAQVTGQTVHLDAAGIGASFDGTLDASAKTLTGQWQQGGASLPLTLTKTDHVPVLSRPQEPKPPFPYTVQDVQFPGGAPGVTLAGTLTLPPGPGPFPAVVLIAGSGPNDRDETIFGHKPFLLLADTLTRRGVAVLRYDKRGIAHSTGSYKLATTQDFATDAYAAVQYLRTRAGIDASRLGLMGHSEGGVIAPMVASQHPSAIKFIVLLAGSALTGERIMLKQAALLAQAGGASRAQITRNAALQKRLFAISERSSDPAKAQAEAREAVLQAVASMPAAQKNAVGDPQAFAEAQSRAVASPWMKYFLTYDPAPALEKTRCPVLALNGSKDLQVPPQEDLAVISNALRAGGNIQATVRELPGLNHLFQNCTTGAVTEYAQIDETMAPAALQIISDWIATQTKTGA